MAQYQHAKGDDRTLTHKYPRSINENGICEAALDNSGAQPARHLICGESHDKPCLSKGKIMFSAETSIGSDSLIGDETLPTIDSDASEWQEERILQLSQLQSHGLCDSFRVESLLDSSWDPALPSSPSAGDVPEPYLDSVMAFVNGTEPFEKWQIDRDSAMFLAAALALGNFGDVLIESSKLNDEQLSFSDLKVMEPVIYCDPELELQRLRRKNMMKFSEIRIKAIELNVEDDESIQWPPTTLSVPAEIDGAIANEKYEVDCRVREYLHEIVEPDTPETIHNLLESEKVSQSKKPKNRNSQSEATLAHNTQVSHPKPLTPPLMLLSPVLSSPNIPSSLQEMPLTSTPDDLLAIEADEASSNIGAMDNSVVVNQSDPLSWDENQKAGADDNMNILCCEFTSPGFALAAPRKIKGLDTLKVEVPLLPLHLDRLPDKPETTAEFPSNIRSLIPNPSSNASIMDSTAAQEDLGTLIEGDLTKAAEPAVLEVAAEKLTEFDTTIRVPVPEPQRTALHPPWHINDSRDGISSMTAQRILLSKTRREFRKNETSWNGVSKLERLLPWSPFPVRLGKIEMDEDLDEVSESYGADLAFDEEFSASWLMSRPTGLHLLDPISSDDGDLESNVWNDEETIGEVEKYDNNGPSMQKLRPPSQTHRSFSIDNQDIHDGGKSSCWSLRSLLQKRRRELEDASKQNAHTPHSGTDMSEIREVIKKPRLTGSNSKPSRPTDLLKQGGIEDFIQLQGGPLSKKPQARGYEIQVVQGTAPEAIMLVPPSAKETGKVPREKIPTPKLVMPQRDIQIVVSTQMLAHRRILRRLHALLPALDLIERLPHSPKNKSDRHDNTGEWREADITISPITGILITTLQKLKQKALPGQKSYFGVWEHAVAMSLQYEKLIILVSEGQQAAGEHDGQVQHLDVRDCDAISDLAKLATSLQGIVEVKYVPGGDEELGDWIAALISQNAMSDDSFRLLQEETMWERFLRAGGLNAYAAQAILAKLKEPTGNSNSGSSCGVDDSEGGVFGLAAFVQMAPEERIARFGALVGGDRVLSRLSRMIDDGWRAA